ncbi:MFS transporter [Agrobacterium pusense]|uniref:MFS transporter n=1 Tax=Agrobacterium pusense TaxID=648995 RepID=UPI001F1FD21B|nr:MFS transporter [Agrobacterium pusense]
MQRHLFVLFLLALTQITGWGVVSVLPVIATTVAVEFRTSLPMIFVGTSVMFVAMGFTAPWTGRAFRRLVPRSVMATGAGMIAAGLYLLALSPDLWVFWAAWVLIGIAGAMFMTTSAYAYIADYAGDRARSLIATLMLVTGLAGSVFWPITAFLDGVVGCASLGICESSPVSGAVSALVPPVRGAATLSTGRFDKADFGFAVEDDMQVPDHAGCLQQGVSHFLIAAPSEFDRKGDGVDVEETVTAGAGWNTDCFAHVAYCRDGPFEHTTLLPAVEVIEPVDVAD